MKNLNNIFLIGPMGSGKSTVGKQLSQLLSCPFFDSDTEIECRTGVSISWIFEIEHEQGFRERERQVIAELTQKQGIVLATGGGVVLMPENRQHLSENGIVVYLTVSVEVQLQRTRHGKDARPLISCKDPGARLYELTEEREPLYRSIANLIYSTNEFSPYKLALQIQHDINTLKAANHNVED
jgi:shikimate kinase